MPPFLALFLWLVLLLGLLCFDPAKVSGSSLALWVPLVWVFIVASRLTSQWLGVGVQLVEEGNSVDRAIFLALILLAVGILVSRSFNWGGFFARNLALMAFVSFALVSVIWSDFPFVAFKRWFRDLGSYLMIIVVLSDPRPLEAVRTLLRRLCYLLIPLSILLEKYYPSLGRQYDRWTGESMIVGAATQKNGLGAVCMISGIFFFWDTVTRWSDRKERRTKRIIMVNFAFLAMTLWLLRLTHSATSSVALVIGCVVIAALHSKWGGRHRTLIKVMAPVSFCIYVVLSFGFNMSGFFAQWVGRNPTLTDRTILWATLLDMHTNPVVGTGYDSFWLGPRLVSVWQVFAPGINEAHNGYLEVYLNLGLIGLILIGGLLISSYRNICGRFTPFSSLASLSISLWTVVLFYNMTEAAFKFHFVWVIFLLAAIAVPPESVALSSNSSQRIRWRVDSSRPSLVAQGPATQKKAADLWKFATRKSGSLEG